MRAQDVNLADLDPFEQGVAWPLFDVLRRDDPVHWSEEAHPNHGFWSVTRQADIIRVLNDPQTFSSEVGGVTLEELDPEQIDARKAMLETDGARHWALRRLLQSRFTPKGLAGHEPILRAFARQVIDTALEREEFDFVEEISAQFPIRALAQLLDVPDERLSQLIDWGNRMVGHHDPEYADVLAGSPESEQFRLLPFRAPAALELFRYGFELAGERAGGDGDDLISLLVNQVPEDGLQLSERDFRNYFLLLVVNGNETTRHAISHTMLALIDNPEQLAILREQPELISKAAAEFLRWASPIYHFRRTATRDVGLHNRTIKSGDKVAVWLASGNRDERVYEDPYRFDVTRPRVEHLAFGKMGPHFCLGNHLARMEIRILFQELIPRLRGIEATADARRMRSSFINGIKSLPVRVTTG